MMRHEHVRAELRGFTNGRHRRVERAGHAFDFCRRVAHEQAGSIPWFGVGRRKHAIQSRDELAHQRRCLRTLFRKRPTAHMAQPPLFLINLVFLFIRHNRPPCLSSRIGYSHLLNARSV